MFEFETENEARLNQPRLGLPDLGIGVGLRNSHFSYLLAESPSVDWFEVISENFMDSAGRPRFVLEQIAERYPVVMHGVSLSIGSCDPLNFDYLRKLKDLALRVRAHWVSDHLCWTGVLGLNSHDLLPLPYTEESLSHVVQRVHIVQDFLERPLILENPSSYITFRESTLSEWEFLTRLTDETNCGLLLDVNNIYVSCQNHDWSSEEYLKNVPLDRVVQIHLAGHTNCLTHLVDTHDGPVITPVWDLYGQVCRSAGNISTLLEWDARIPSFSEMHAEALKAKAWRQQTSDRPFLPSQSVDSLAHCEMHSPCEVSAIPHPTTFISAEAE